MEKHILHVSFTNMYNIINKIIKYEKHNLYNKMPIKENNKPHLQQLNCINIHLCSI